MYQHDLSVFEPVNIANDSKKTQPCFPIVRLSLKRKTMPSVSMILPQIIEVYFHEDCIWNNLLIPVRDLWSLKRVVNTGDTQSDYGCADNSHVPPANCMRKQARCLSASF